jgi:hypothetical protein
MALFKFPSIAHSAKYGYSYDTGAWSSHSETSGYFQQFETYGDGLIQHSGSWSVTFDFLTDYLASIAEAMLSNPELIAAVGSMFRAYPDTEAIAFAASVVWRESDGDWSKRRYYSKSLQKIGNHKKQYDTRYTEVTRYQDGSCASMLRVILSDYAGGLERYIASETVRMWAHSQKTHPGYGEGWPEYFGGDWAKNNALRNTLEGCRAIVESVRLREAAVCSVENYRRCLARAADAAADADAARAAADAVA